MEDEDLKQELTKKFDEFYRTKVEGKLEGFDIARRIYNISIVMFWIIAFSIILCFLFLMTLPILLVPLPFNLKLYNPNLTLIIVLLAFLLPFVIVFVIMPPLRRVDKNNVIKIFKTSDSYSIALPASADAGIKEYLMSDFVKMFGDFLWTINSVNEKTSKLIDTNYRKNLRIFNVPILIFDDIIYGSYKGIDIRLADADSSVFKPSLFFLVAFVLCFLGPFALFVLSFILIAGLVFAIRYVSSKHFRGLVVEIDMNKSFQGHTFILEKNNVKDSLINLGDYERVNLEDPEFNNDFVVYSQNQVEARYLLTTAFMERLRKIKWTFNAKYIRVSFKDEKIVLAIHTGRDMFQMARHRKMTKETFVQLFREIYSVLRLVDVLKLNQKIGM